MRSLLKTSPVAEENDPADRSARTSLAPPSASLPSAAPVIVDWETAPGQFKADWDVAMARAPFVAHQQSYDYGAAVAAMGGTVRRARLRVDGALIGVAQAIRHITYPYLPTVHVMRGPVWARPDISPAHKAAAAKALCATAPAKGLYAVFITPAEGDDLSNAPLKRVYTGAHTVLVDLAADDEIIRKRLNGKWRNRLKAAEKDDVTVARLARRPEKFAWLLEKDETLMRSIGHRSSNPALIPAYHRIAGKKSVLAFEAKSGAERIGGMLFLIHGAGATYHIGWSNEEGKARNAQNLLMWTGMLELKRQGVRMLDLGGVDTDALPTIARFKLGLGGKVVSTAGSWTNGPRWG